MIPRVVCATVVAIVLAGIAAAAFADAPTEQVQKHIDQIVRMVSDPAFRQKPPEVREAAIRRVADQIFDWTEMSKRALGVHWRERTPAEREEFVRLFSDLLERAYVSRIESYQGEKIAYLGDSVQGDTAVVRTAIVTKQGNQVPLDYRLIREPDGSWKVYDVDISGVSLVSNYRTQFNDVIRRGSYPELVKRIRAKLQEPAPSASPRSAR